MALAFEATRREGATAGRLAAVFGIFFALLFLASTYMRRFGSARTRLLRLQLGLFTGMTLLVAAAKAMLLFTALPEIWIPLATVPLGSRSRSIGARPFS